MENTQNPLSKIISLIKSSEKKYKEKKFKESLDLLEAIEDKTASIYELIGDCYVYLGANDNARINYLKAMEASPSESVKSIIKMKLSDIN